MHASIPVTVVWAYAVFALVLAAGCAHLIRSGAWARAHGMERAILLGPLCYAAPIAAFGTEHFTLTHAIASLVPGWIPFHLFWTYLIGSCFVVAGFSLVTGIGARYAALGLALNFAVFVAVMDLPAWVHHPSQLAFTFVLREFAFCIGPLGLAAALSPEVKLARGAAAGVRYGLALVALFYSFEQFRRGAYVPGVPLEPLTPTYIIGHAIWTYLAAASYALCGALLVWNRWTRAAAAWLGATVLWVILVVYLPIAWVQFASLDNGFDYLGDTLLFAGAVLLAAAAMSASGARAAAAHPRTVQAVIL